MVSEMNILFELNLVVLILVSFPRVFPLQVFQTEAEEDGSSLGISVNQYTRSVCASGISRADRTVNRYRMVVVT